MVEHAELEAALRRVLAVLQPYAEDVVLIGGWVPYLHQRYGGLTAWKGPLSFTSEADVLLKDRELARGKRPPIPELLTAAGLQPVNDKPTGSAVWRSSSGAEEVEFLVPLTGPLSRQVLTMVVGQPGLAAISLPDLDILERHNVILKLPPNNAPLSVRVPVLGAYVLHKSATFVRRMPEAGESTSPKRAKDMLYLRDVMAAGDEVVTKVGNELRIILKTDKSAERLRANGVRNLRPFVENESNAHIRLVARMLAERDTSALNSAVSDVSGYLGDLMSLLEDVKQKKRSRS